MQIARTLACTGLIALARSASVVSIPAEDAYLLTPTFSGDDRESFNTWAYTTNTTDSALNVLLHSAKNASLISYDDEFLAIFGTNSSFKLIEERTTDFAAEGGAWAWDRNEVWFTSGVEGVDATSVSILNLADNTISTPSFSGDPLPNPNGAYYFNCTVYFTTAGNETHAGGIVSVDPATKVVTTILNSYYGFRFNYLDDLAWVQKGSNSYLYFTDLGAPALTKTFPALSSNPEEMLQNAIWRFDPQRKSLRPVIPRSDLAIPNGVRVNAEGTKLIVGDSSYAGLSGAANSSFGSGALYEYELDDRGLPVKKSMFGLTRQGLVDGIKLDDAGNVWSAEYDGIWVRDSEGKVLGVVNALPLVVDGAAYPLQNFALAGDTLVIFAQLRLWTVKLAKQVVQSGNLS